MAEATIKLPPFPSISDPRWVCLDNFVFVVPIIWIFSTGKHTEMMTRLSRSACWVWVYIEWELPFSAVLQYCAVLMLAWLVHYSGCTDQGHTGTETVLRRCNCTNKSTVIQCSDKATFSKQLAPFIAAPKTYKLHALMPSIQLEMLPLYIINSQFTMGTTQYCTHLHQ